MVNNRILLFTIMSAFLCYSCSSNVVNLNQKNKDNTSSIEPIISWKSYKNQLILVKKSEPLLSISLVKNNNETVLLIDLKKLVNMADTNLNSIPLSTFDISISGLQSEFFIILSAGPISYLYRMDGKGDIKYLGSVNFYIKDFETYGENFYAASTTVGLMKINIDNLSYVNIYKMPEINHIEILNDIIIFGSKDSILLYNINEGDVTNFKK